MEVASVVSALAPEDDGAEAADEAEVTGTGIGTTVVPDEL